MIIFETGKITENVYMLGHPASPMYLVDGRQPILIDTGYTFMTDIYLKELKQTLGNRQPAYCLITHAHFDHCGATAGLKKHFPGMQVAASELARTILLRPNVIKTIRNLNQSAETIRRELDIHVSNSRVFEPFDVEITLCEGDVLRPSDQLSIHTLETPGHTRDMLTFYLPEQRMLFASEVLGIPDPTGYIEVSCLIDYDQHVTSMKKLVDLDIDIICLGHRGVYTGHDVAHYVKKAMGDYNDFCQTVCRFLADENGDISRVMQRVREYEYDPKPKPRQPEPAYLINLEARVKVIAKKMYNPARE